MYYEQILDVEKEELIKIQGVPLILHKVKIDRGIPWHKAVALRNEHLAKLKALKEAAQAQDGKQGGKKRPAAGGAAGKPKKKGKGGGGGGGSQQQGAEEEEEEEEEEIHDLLEPDGSTFDGTGSGFYWLQHYPDQVVLALALPNSVFARGPREGSYGARMEKVTPPTHPHTALHSKRLVLLYLPNPPTQPTHPALQDHLSQHRRARDRRAFHVQGVDHARGRPPSPLPQVWTFPPRAGACGAEVAELLQRHAQPVPAPGPRADARVAHRQGRATARAGRRPPVLVQPAQRVAPQVRRYVHT